MLAYIAFAGIVGAVAIFCVVAGGWIIIYALRTGIMPTRRRTYDKKTEPIRYYGMIIFWIVMMALFGLLTALALRHLYLHSS